MTRYERHYPFFGEAGQDRVRSMTVAIVGAGGTGSHVIQQLAYLGVGSMAVIDNEELDESNLNRYVTAFHDDPIPGSRKVRLGRRLVERIASTIAVEEVYNTLVSEEAFGVIQGADAVFGCVDKDGIRFILNELCAAYDRPYFDVASEITPAGDYGGRVCVSFEGKGCLVCYDQLDQEEIEAQLSSMEQKGARRGAYGVPAEDLGNSGPSVVSINGVVASLGVTEFMLWATGLRAPKSLLTYDAKWGIVRQPGPEDYRPWPDCYYCKSVRGQRDAADVQRYIRQNAGNGSA